MTAPRTPPPADRQALLALTPRQYLARGFRQPDGAAWPELTTTWSLAAAEQLRAARVDPAQLDRATGPVVRVALRSRGTPLGATQAELSGLIASPAVSDSIRALVEACIAALRSSEDLEPMAEHLASVQQYLALNSAIAPR